MILFTLWFFSWYFIVVLVFFYNILIKTWSTSFQNPVLIWFIPVHITTNCIPKVHYKAILLHMYPVISQVAYFCDVLQNSDSQYQQCQIKRCSLLNDLHIYLINLLLNNSVSIVSYELKKCDTACVMYIHILRSEGCGYTHMQYDEIFWCRYCQHVCTLWGIMYIFITISPI
jgi:hypothetical protein